MGSQRVEHNWATNTHSQFRPEGRILKFQSVVKKKCSWHSVAAAAAAKLIQSYPTWCDPRDGSPPGSPIPGIFQARTLEWVAISFSNAWKWKGKVTSLLSRVRLPATPWTEAYQAPPSMGFYRHEYWSGVPLPSLDTALLYSKKNVIAIAKINFQFFQRSFDF